MNTMNKNRGFGSQRRADAPEDNELRFGAKKQVLISIASNGGFLITTSQATKEGTIERDLFTTMSVDNAIAIIKDRLLEM